MLANFYFFKIIIIILTLAVFTLIEQEPNDLSFQSGTGNRFYLLKPKQTNKQTQWLTKVKE